MRNSFFCFFLLTFCVIQAANGQSKNAAFETFISKYEASINEADTLAGAAIWLKAPEVSFIHPRGTEYGWKGIKNVYDMFATVFTTRKLRASNLKVAEYGDVAWLTFEWVFDAVMKDGKPLQTKGRETQILRKVNKEWKLVHVHYSAMPVTGNGQGF